MISGIDPLQIILQYSLLNETVLIPFHELDHLLHSTIRTSFAQGLAVGCSLLLIFVSWFIIINKKTPIFLFHQCCLVLLAVRSLLYLFYLLSPLSSLSYRFTGVFDGYWSAFRISQAVNATYLMLITMIEVVFVFQIYVMFRLASKRIWGRLITALSAVLGLAVVVIYIFNIVRRINVTRDGFAGTDIHESSWMDNVPYLLFAASLNLNSVALITKLVMAIRARRTMGLRQFDALHVLVIMTAQTSLAPSAMVIYNYADAASSSLYINISLILIVCGLPFSSLWASSSNKSSTPSSCQNSILSRVLDTSSQTISFAPETKVQKFDSPLSGFEKETLSNSVGGDTDSIERIIHEFKETPSTPVFP